MVVERDVRLHDGRVVHAYDGGGDGDALIWHHGSPQTGAPLPPLLDAAAAPRDPAAVLRPSQLRRFESAFRP